MQDMGVQRKCYANTYLSAIVDINPMVMSNNNSKNNYFHLGLDEEDDRRVNTKITK